MVQSKLLSSITTMASIWTQLFECSVPDLCDMYSPLDCCAEASFLQALELFAAAPSYAGACPADPSWSWAACPSPYHSSVSMRQISNQEGHDQHGQKLDISS